jgi:hypothetical protein
MQCLPRRYAIKNRQRRKAACTQYFTPLGEPIPRRRSLGVVRDNPSPWQLLEKARRLPPHDIPRRAFFTVLAGRAICSAVTVCSYTSWSHALVSHRPLFSRLGLGGGVARESSCRTERGFHPVYFYPPTIHLCLDHHQRAFLAGFHRFAMGGLYSPPNTWINSKRAVLRELIPALEKTVRPLIYAEEAQHDETTELPRPCSVRLQVLHDLSSIPPFASAASTAVTART